MQVRPVSGLGKQRPCPEHVTLPLQNVVYMGPYHSAEHLQVRISANGDPGSGSKPLISVTGRVRYRPSCGHCLECRRSRCTSSCLRRTPANSNVIITSHSSTSESCYRTRNLECS